MSMSDVFVEVGMNMVGQKIEIDRIEVDQLKKGINSQSISILL